MALKSFDFDNSLKGLVILIVENEVPERLKYEQYAASLGMTTISAPSKNAALETIEDQTIDCAFCDLHLSTEAGIDVPDGLEVIRSLKAVQVQASIIAMSSDPRRDMGDQAMGAGAHHFARKPFQSIEDFKIAMRLAFQRRTLTKKASSSTAGDILQKFPEGIVISGALRSVLVKLAKRPDVCLNLCGETGTGKEEIAKLYHGLRSKTEGPLPFVAVNCAQLNPSIADSELFGHRKGAFTGAVDNTIGFIGEAHGGILFLDEIHTLDLQVQAKLLRVLNNGTYTRVGDARPRSSQFQLITASTKDLEELSLAGAFALDLKMRIDGYPIILAPLRDRKNDIPDLLRLALSRAGKELSDKKISEISAVLQEFQWAGNIRQFLKVISAWLLHCELHDLPLEAQYIPITQTMRGGASQKAGSIPISPISNLNPHSPAIQELTFALNNDQPLQKTLDIIEKEIIAQAVCRHKTLGEAADALDLSRSVFDARRRKYDLINNS